MRQTILAATALGLLGGCSGQEPATAPGGGPPPAPPRSEAQRLAVVAALPAPWNAADLENGRRVFARCRSCHTLPESAPNMTGPNLYGVFGRTAGVHPGFNYSKPLQTAGFEWTPARLDQWLRSPRSFLPGNKMSFPGLPDETDRRDVVAFLAAETTPAA